MKLQYAGSFFKKNKQQDASRTAYHSGTEGALLLVKI
jgi:hypothetical protein